MFKRKLQVEVSQRTALGLSVVVILVAASVAALTARAFVGAGASNGMPLVIPYQGTLAENQQPVTGQRDMTFAIYDGPEGSGASKLWETTTARSVDVVDGVFSINLGANPDPQLSSSIFDHDGLFLEVVVDGTPLLPWQQVAPAPHAIRAAQAVDFVVSDHLQIGGSMDVGGTADVTGNLNVDGSTDLSGPTSVHSPVTFYSAPDVKVNSSGRSGGALVIGPGGTYEMRIDENEIESKGNLWLNRDSGDPVRMGGDLEVHGNLKVIGNYTKENCRWVSCSNPPAGSTRNCLCGGGEFQVGVTNYDQAGDGVDMERVTRIRCCH